MILCIQERETHMGIYYSAMALIGYKIGLSKFNETKEIPSCEHNAENAKFCPTCGKKVENLKRTYVIDEFNDFYEEILENIKDKQIIWDFDYNNDYVYIGYGVRCSDEESKYIELPSDIESVKQKLHDILKPMEKYLTFDKFGLWVTHIGK
jgi:hypothetical protein